MSTPILDFTQEIKVSKLPSRSTRKTGARVNCTTDLEIVPTLPMFHSKTGSMNMSANKCDGAS